MTIQLKLQARQEIVIKDNKQHENRRKYNLDKNNTYPQGQRVYNVVLQILGKVWMQTQLQIFLQKHELKYHKGGRICQEFADADKLNFLVPREKEIKMKYMQV